MPADVFARAPRGAAAVVSSVMVAGLGLWGVGAPLSQVQATDIAVASVTPQVIDMSTSTVADILTHQYETDRFYLLLLETDTLPEITGTGPYTVYAPDDSAFDYLLRTEYVDLSSDERLALAQAQLAVGSLPPGVKVMEEYEASNGVIYVTNEVLPALSTTTAQ